MDISGKADHVEVFVDVVHDLGLEEGLGSVVHDLVAELGLGDVLPQLFDSSASALSGTVLVNDLVTLVLGCRAIFFEFGNKLSNYFELSPEERILGGVHDIPVHLEEGGVDSGNGLDKALKTGGDLELPKETGGDASSGGAGETDLIGDNDGGGDEGSFKGTAKSVKVGLEGGRGVADGDSIVRESGELSLHLLNDVMKRDNLLSFHFILLLVNIDKLELAVVFLDLSLNDLDKLCFINFYSISGDIAEFGILSNLVWWPGANGVSIDINNGLLSHVDPDNLSILGVSFSADLVEDIGESLDSGLAAAVHLVSGLSSEVGHSHCFVGKLLDLVKKIRHGSGLPYLGLVCHDA